MRQRWAARWTSILLIVSSGIWGCVSGEKKLSYLGDRPLNYYQSAATHIDYPHVHSSTPEEITFATKPRTVLDRQHDEVWDLSLADARQLALSNNSIIRSRSTFTSSGNPILASPNNVPSVYDPAIQESGVLFGGRGVEAALADFDTQFSTTMVWGKSETAQNNSFLGFGLGGGSTLTADTGVFQAQLSKQFSYGGRLTVNHNWNYTGSNAPAVLFRSAYSGFLQTQYRQPLWAGAGTEFNRIAGALQSNFQGITGVNQGVVIARINNDITLADFEANSRNLLKDVEDLYWDLYLTYRVYDTAVSARNSALRTWRESKAKLDIGGVRNFKPADEAQARDRYFETRSQSETALSNLYSTESQFRRLLGLPVNDGRIIRPVDEPVTAQFVPDWYVCLTEALTRRVELRRQKWNIKSLQLQLKAASSLARPRLDFVSSYQVNALGDHLLASGDGDDLSQGFNSAYEALTQGNQTGWNLGFEFSMPLGFRSALAQQRNLELRLAKARDVLATQELEISHELASTFQNLSVQYVTAQANFNRRRAAQRRVQYYRAEVEAGTQTLDLELRAQASLADAEVAYYQSLSAYNKSIAEIHYRKGTLLEYDGVKLAESEWTHQAYKDALRHAWARSHGFSAKHVWTEPREFVTGEMLQDVDLSDATNDGSGVHPGEPPRVPADDHSTLPESADNNALLPVPVLDDSLDHSS